MTTSAAPADYSVQVKLRNNRILARIRRAGFTSLRAFCDRHALNYQTVSAYVCIRIPAVTRHGEFRKIAVDLATALHVEPEELFTERQARANLTPKVERELNEHEALRLSFDDAKYLPAPDEPADEVIGRRMVVQKALAALPPREREIIEARFGFDGPELTREELAAKYDVTISRVAQLETIALHRLKHPSLSRDLRHYGDPRVVAKFEAEHAQERERQLRAREAAQRRQAEALFREEQRAKAVREAVREAVVWQRAGLDALEKAAPEAPPDNRKAFWLQQAIMARQCWACRYVHVPGGDVLGTGWRCVHKEKWRLCREVRMAECADGVLFEPREDDWQ